MTAVTLSKSDAQRLAVLLGKQPVDSGLAEFHQMLTKQLGPVKGAKEKEVASKKATKAPSKLTPTEVARRHLNANPKISAADLRAYLVMKGIANKIAAITCKRLIKE